MSLSQRNLQLTRLNAAALLVALSVILTRVFSSVFIIFGASVRLGFGSVPIIYGGFLLGPFYGSLIGLASDLIGILINPMGVPHPGITLTSLLVGLLPGLVVYFWRRQHIWALILGWALTAVLCSQLLQTYWLSQLMTKNYWALFLGRLAAFPLNQGLNLLVLLAIFPLTKQLPNRLRYLQQPGILFKAPGTASEKLSGRGD